MGELSWRGRQAEKLGTVMTWVQVLSATMVFFLPESTFSADSLSVFVRPPRANRMHQHLRACQKS